MEDKNQQTDRPTRRSQQNGEALSSEQTQRRAQQESIQDIQQPAYLRGEKKQASQAEPPVPQGHPRLDEVYQVIDQIEDVILNGKKVPLSKNIGLLDIGVLKDLVGQLRLGFPRTLTEAEEIIEARDKILDNANQRASGRERDADNYYDDKVTSADQYSQETRMSADKYDRELRALANQDANNMIADAQTRAEQIIQAAQHQQAEMIMENEIVRRANAFALEIRDKAQRESDQVYSQACLQSDKVLSGATAALSKAANDLAQLRDTLLNPNGGTQGNYPG